MSFKAQFTAVTARPRRVAYPGDVIDELNEMTYDHAVTIVQSVSPYPPEPPGSKYVRTYNLLRNWRIKRTINWQGGLTAQILNPVKDPKGKWYAARVHGPLGTQWPTHTKTGWRSLADYLKRARFKHKAQLIITKGVRRP